jgi:uncharacterized protein (DUF697 family)
MPTSASATTCARSRRASAADRIDLAVLDRHARRTSVDRRRRASRCRRPKSRRYAYEVAVAVVAADGAHTPAEGAFLRDLASALGLPAQSAQSFVAEADAIAAAPAAAVAGTVMPDAAALDKQILDASITNAALEILPETLASMAILPLQVRLVYRIGKPTATSSTRATSRSSSPALGVGLAGQYIEQFGRKLLGGLLGSVLGGWVAPPATRRRAPGWRSRRRGRSARSRSSTTAAGARSTATSSRPRSRRCSRRDRRSSTATAATSRSARARSTSATCRR